MLLTMFLTTQEAPIGAHTSPERLLRMIAAGDREAMTALYERTRVAVYALALSVVKHPQDAQDLTQDTYVRIWEKAGAWRQEGPAMGWILAIARNLARMKLRDRGREGDMSEEQWEKLPAQMPQVTVEDRLVLRTALETLTEEERQLVLLHAVSGVRHREIAAALELPLPTVLSKYHRALKKLRLRLEGAEQGDK